MRQGPLPFVFPGPSAQRPPLWVGICLDDNDNDQMTRRITVDRATTIRSIQGMAHHSGWTRDILIDVASTITDQDLNDPLESIADLTTAELREVRQGILNWNRVNTVLDNNGVLDQQAISRVMSMASHTTAEGTTNVAKQVTALDINAAAEVLIQGLSAKTTVMHIEGSKGRWPDEEIIPTGCLSLDMAIGIGGIPRGRIGEVYGAESSGKSSLMMMMAAQAQKQGMLVLYIDSEHSLNPEYAAGLGMDLSTALINYPSSLQDAINTMQVAMDLSGQAGMPDLLIVVDSVPALPAQEMDGVDAREKDFRQLNARHWSTWMPMLVRKAGETRTTILLVNQTRASMDMYTKLSDTTPGGKAIKFAASFRFEVSRKSNPGQKDDAGQQGQETWVRIVKNKVGSPFKKATYFLWTNTPTGFVGIDQFEDTWTAAKSAGVIMADTKFENGELVDKQKWYCIPLRPEWLQLIWDDERDEQSTDPETGEVNPDWSEDDWYTNFPEGTKVMQAYNESPAQDLLARFPRLVAAIRQATLDTLGNVSPDMSFLDPSVESMPDNIEDLVNSDDEEEEGDQQKSSDDQDDE